MLRVAIIMIGLLLSHQTFLCYGGSVSFDIQTEVTGVLKLVDSPLCFADGSCQTSAVFSDGSAIWGQITGMIDNQIDLSQKFTTKEDTANKNISNGYAGLDIFGRLPITQAPNSNYRVVDVPLSEVSPQWHTDSSNWVELPEYTTYFQHVAGQPVRIHFTDNIGIYNASWCNVGIFFDNIAEPVCVAAWSGVSGSMIFNQQSIDCVVLPSRSVALANQAFQVSVKHRSQYCTYGNYAFDQYGITRQLSLQEFM